MEEIIVKLAGMNIDIDGLKEIKKILEEQQINLSLLEKKEILENTKNTISDLNRNNAEAITILTNLTPETIAASYARISRDGRPIPELRIDSRKDVDSARKSYSVINFGMGHKSIAEHVQLNFDIMGISRRAVEEIESKRLQGYTEKSQRYITLDGDFVLPNEIKNTNLAKNFLQLIEKQNAFYNKHLEKLTVWHSLQDYSANFESLGCADKPDKQIGTIEGYGKEDARYTLAQATQAQLGMTTSGRNLETLISRLKSSNVLEFKEMGQKLFDEINGLAPSVIKYTEPTDYFEKTREELSEFVKQNILLNNVYKEDALNADMPKYFSSKEVSLYHSLKRDDSIPAGLIFSSSDESFFSSLLHSIKMSDEQKLALRRQADKYQERHDPKLREYELGDRVAEFVMSSSAFAQIKRHRMNTLIPQEYNVDLGWTIPESVKETNLINEFNSLMKESTNLYGAMINEGVPRPVADYILTNAHRRRVLFDANNRQVHAFGAERQNLPAQWDIRNLANQYVSLITKESPLTLGHVCGKDKFYETKTKFMKNE